MRPLVRRVPQLQRLAVFDTVASKGGFTAAAKDLRSTNLLRPDTLVPVGPVVEREHGGQHACWPNGRADARHHAVAQFLDRELSDRSSDFGA